MSKRLFSTMMITLALLAPGLAVTAAPSVVHAANPSQGGGNSSSQNNNPKNTGKKDSNGALQNNQGENVDPITGTVVKDTSVVEYISAAYSWLAIIGGLLAVIMLIYAGYSYMASNGDPERISNAKDIVEKALLGLGLLIIATVLLKAVNTRTVDPCTPGQPGCGEIDFTKPNGGVKETK